MGKVSPFWVFIAAFALFICVGIGLAVKKMRVNPFEPMTIEQIVDAGDLSPRAKDLATVALRRRGKAAIDRLEKIVTSSGPNTSRVDNACYFLTVLGEDSNDFLIQRVESDPVGATYLVAYMLQGPHAAAAVPKLVAASLKGTKASLNILSTLESYPSTEVANEFCRQIDHVSPAMLERVTRLASQTGGKGDANRIRDRLNFVQAHGGKISRNDYLAIQQAMRVMNSRQW